MLPSSPINLYNFSSTVLMSVPSGNKSLSWLLVFSSVYWFSRFDKKKFHLACLPFNFWIGLKYQRVLWLVNAVSLFSNRSIQINQSSSMSFRILGLFPDNMFIALLTIVSMSCAIVIHFCRSIFMTLTVKTSLTEVAF